ncbi:hypothetical protein [Malacoplasma penetrans HF-2]|uniref:Uncharacterized protein n=2 Tax=Malacoplasma penetrans TaxID=28227 RepID=Q8EVT4_MALP2|nr:hypothetical protein [Malacoplasma penetrans HF-2]
MFITILNLKFSIVIFIINTWNINKICILLEHKNSVRIITSKAKCYMEFTKIKKEKIIQEVIPPSKDIDGSIEGMLGKILDKMDVIELDLKTLKEDVAILKLDVTQLKTDMVEVKSDVALLKQDVAILKADMIDVKSGKYCKNHNLYENA